MRRWSDLSQVERVDVYTRQSLYFFLWVFVGIFMLSGLVDEPPEDGYLTLLLAGFAVLTLAATVVLRDVMDLHPSTRPLPWRSGSVLVGLCVAATAFAMSRPESLRTGISISAFVCLLWALGGLRDQKAAVGIVVGGVLLLGVGTGRPAYLVGGLAMALFLVFTVRVSLWLVGVVTELDQAQASQAALAVAEERLRFSRDVHDVMGRRLSTIAVQSELAATLTERGDAGAGEQMLAVRGLAHEALREARELARGYRPIDLDQELDGARSLLRSAGIDVDLAVDAVPDQWQEAAAWVVREAVTNVLRHSAATQVRITFRSPDLVVVSNGATRSDASPSGAGISGLQERLAPLGASLSAEQDGDSFRLVARLPSTEVGR